MTALDLVTADGSLIRVDRSSPDLAALAVGLGAFGVVARVVLDVEPAYLVRQDVYRHAAWETVLGRLDEVMASAYSVSLLADFASPVVAQVWQKTRVGVGEAVSAARSLYGGSWSDDADEAVGSNLNVRGGVVGPWSERMPHFRLDSRPSAGGDELQSEYFVDRRHGVAALRVLRSLGERISPHLHIAEVRTVAADELWLSPAFQRASLCIGFTWRRHPVQVAALLPVIEGALAPFAPRPHWGKLFGFRHADLAARFPRLSDFAALIAAYDPAGKFSNAFLDGILGTTPG